MKRRSSKSCATPAPLLSQRGFFSRPPDSDPFTTVSKNPSRAPQLLSSFLGTATNQVKKMAPTSWGWGGGRDRGRALGVRAAPFLLFLPPESRIASGCPRHDPPSDDPRRLAPYAGRVKSAKPTLIAVRGATATKICSILGTAKLLFVKKHPFKKRPPEMGMRYGTCVPRTAEIRALCS